MEHQHVGRNSSGCLCPEETSDSPRLLFFWLGYRRSLVVRLRNSVSSGHKHPEENSYVMVWLAPVHGHFWYGLVAGSGGVRGFEKVPGPVYGRGVFSKFIKFRFFVKIREKKIRFKSSDSKFKFKILNQKMKFTMRRNKKQDLAPFARAPDGQEQFLFSEKAQKTQNQLRLSSGIGG